MKKRFSCLLLVLCLLYQVLPFTAHAAETVSGVIPKRDGYEVATVRCESADGSCFFVDFTPTDAGYAYQFTAPAQAYSVKAEYYSLTVWDGAVDISWYDAGKEAFYLDNPAQLAGLAALVNGQVDVGTPDTRIRGDRSELVSTKIEDFLLVGAGGGNQHGTVYRGDVAHDFSDKTVYLTADMDMGGSENWTPIGGKYAMDFETSEYLIEAFFNGTLDGQGHRITNLFCDRYAAKGYAYSQAVGLIGYLGELYDGQSAPETAPAVRNLSVSGSITGRRMVGGIVGRTGSIPTGVLIENCANFADVHNTDSKGIGGIVGAGWSRGAIVNCYNAGCVTTTYACPAGGICGSNGGLDIFNCYNVGKIDSSGNARARAIGSHDRGSYTVSDCYYLSGCDDDPASSGWYCGTALGIQVSTQALSDTEMRAGTLLGLLNCNGDAYAQKDGGYPVLSWEQGTLSERYALTVSQPEGGTVQADAAASVRGGTVLHLSHEPQTGWSFRYYTLNGKPLSGSYATVTGDSVISAVFTPMISGTLVLQPHPACTISVKKDGTALVDGVLTQVTDYPVSDGDPLYEGDVLTVTASLLPNAEPDDLNEVYSGTFRYSFTYQDETAEGKQTDTGRFIVTGNITTASLLVSTQPYTTHKIWTQLAETDWYDASQTTFTLTSARQLAGLALLVRQGNSFAEKTVKLGADISLANDDKTYNRSVRWFDGIGGLQAPFCGTFDGCGYQITQMTAVSQGSNAALFLATDGAVLKNIRVQGEISADGVAAAIVAQAKNTRIEDCVNSAGVTAAGDKAGGIAAIVDAGSVLLRCSNYGAIRGTDGVGGLVGIVADRDSTITDCINYVEVSGNGSSIGIGGIAGRIGGSLLRCANYGAVSGSCWYMGGVTGTCNTDSGGRLTDCYNIAAVTNAHTYGSCGTGGLVGYGNYYRLENCYDYGAVTAVAGTLGAIIGKDSKRVANALQNTFYLDGCCTFACNGEGQKAGIEAISSAQFASQEFLQTLNRSGGFALLNGLYPELAVLCQHRQTQLQNVKAATCTEAGYTGDTVCLVCGAVISGGSATPQIICPGSGFRDMPAAANWAHSGIDFALQNGLFDGTSSTTFSPNGSMTRAMLVTVLWRLDGKTAAAGTNPFSDVPAGKWYTDAVIWAAENEIVTGVGNNRFDPSGNVTREQMAAILFRYAGKKGLQTDKRADLSKYPDGSKTSAWAENALSWANAESLISGSAQAGTVYLLPRGNATRAQVAAILMRYVNNVVKE